MSQEDSATVLNCRNTIHQRYCFIGQAPPATLHRLEYVTDSHCVSYFYLFLGLKDKKIAKRCLTFQPPANIHRPRTHWSNGSCSWTYTLSVAENRRCAVVVVQYGSTGPTCAAAALMMPRNERETQKCPFQIFQTILDWAEEHLAPSVEQDFVFSCPFIRMQPQLLSGYLSVGKLGLVPGWHMDGALGQKWDPLYCLTSIKMLKHSSIYVQNLKVVENMNYVRAELTHLYQREMVSVQNIFNCLHQIFLFSLDYNEAPAPASLLLLLPCGFNMILRNT